MSSLPIFDNGKASPLEEQGVNASFCKVVCCNMALARNFLNILPPDFHGNMHVASTVSVIHTYAPTALFPLKMHFLSFSPIQFDRLNPSKCCHLLLLQEFFEESFVLIFWSTYRPRSPFLLSSRNSFRALVAMYRKFVSKITALYVSIYAVMW